MGHSQIAEQLRFMYGQDFLYRFHFNYYQITNHQIQPQ